jgi:nucleoid DNA-binding protein
MGSPQRWIATSEKRSFKVQKKKSASKSGSAAARKIPKADKPRSKGTVMSDIAESTGLTRKQVSGVFEALSNMIGQDLQKTGPQQFTLPGMAKFTVQRKPATKARKGINPFTGEETMFKAKPARNVVKIRPLKALKDRV